MRERARRLLGDVRAPWWIAPLALVLMLPALWTGYLLDDHLQHLMLTDTVPLMSRRPDQLYTFMPADPAWKHTARSLGVMPWFAKPELFVSFWRPISSLSLALDQLMAPNVAVVAHLHSLLWYGALVVVVGSLYRRLLEPAWLAGLATLLFAIDDAHGFGTAWIANRHALISLTFGTTALIFHVRWRRGGQRRAAWLAPAAFALALLSGETALTLTAYLLAFALFVDGGTLKAKLTSLAPIASVCVVWRIFYKALGYGAGGSGMYIDPAVDPLAFGQATLKRMPLLLQGQLLRLSPESLGLFAPDRLWLFAGIAALSSTLVLWICLRGIEGDKALAKFWLCGMLLSALPLCATMPHDRLLMPIGLGAFGLLALFLKSAQTGVVDRGARWLLVVVHLVLAPLLLPLRAYSAKVLAKLFDSAAFSLDNVQPLEGRTLVIVNGPTLFHTSWATLLRHSHRLSIPDHQIALGSTQDRVHITRVDERTLELRAQHGYVQPPFNDLLNDVAMPFHVGDTFDSNGLSVRITEVTSDGRPATIRCRLDHSLDAPGYAWANWERAGYVEFAPPPVGGSTTTLAVSMSDLFGAALRDL